MQSYPAWPAFALALTALFTKTTLTSILQVVSRLRAKTFLLPEDARLMGVRPVASEAQLVQRCAGVWRNDTENLPLFLALALAYVLGGASLGSAALLFGLYVAARYLHTLAYLFGLQPWRAICYLASLALCWTIAVRVVLIAINTTN